MGGARFVSIELVESVGSKEDETMQGPIIFAVRREYVPEVG